VDARSSDELGMLLVLLPLLAVDPLSLPLFVLLQPNAARAIAMVTMRMVLLRSVFMSVSYVVVFAGDELDVSVLVVVVPVVPVRLVVFVALVAGAAVSPVTIVSVEPCCSL